MCVSCCEGCCLYWKLRLENLFQLFRRIHDPEQHSWKIQNIKNIGFVISIVHIQYQVYKVSIKMRIPMHFDIWVYLIKSCWSCRYVMPTALVHSKNSSFCWYSLLFLPIIHEGPFDHHRLIDTSIHYQHIILLTYTMYMHRKFTIHVHKLHHILHNVGRYIDILLWYG